MARSSPPPPPNSLSSQQRRLHSLGKLLEVTRALADEIDPTRILQIIAEGACGALDCDRASLFQFDARRNELYTRVVTRLEISEIRKPLDQGITGEVARSRTLANIPDASSDPRWDGSVDRTTGYTTRSILAVPVISPHDDSLLGVLQLLNKNDGPFTDDDQQLAAAFVQHVAAALDRANLVEKLRQREQTQASLAVAREIQRGFMPSELPEVPGYELAVWWLPNEAVGGDYCDVLHLRDGRLALVIADVSGHGLGPSLIMASVRAALRALILERTAPGELLEQLGDALAGDFRDGRFITMVLAAVDPRSHQVQFANAGHAPALWYSPAGDRFTPLEASGLPLGVVDNTNYPALPSQTIEPGDILFLCTDGIVEAMDEQDRQFGLDQLQGLIRQHARGDLDTLVQTVARCVDAHFVGESPPDDLTILALRRVK